MQQIWIIAVPPCATAFALAIVLLGARAIIVLRGLLYAAQRRARRKLRDELRNQWPLPKHELSLFATSLLGLLETEHRRAIAQQDEHYRSVARLATSLTLAFTSAAFVTTIGKNDPILVYACAWMDSVALFLALFYFRVGQTTKDTWIRLRVHAELMRQFVFLGVLLPHVFVREPWGGLTSAFYAKSSQIHRDVISSDMGELSNAVKELWKVCRSKIEGETLRAGTTPSKVAVAFYLNRRAFYQLVWFRTSKERLLRIEKQRTRTLEALYVTTFILASAKLFVMLAVGHFAHSLFGDALEFLILMATGVSATFTGFYLTQGVQTLAYRYKRQEKSIEDWLKSQIRPLDISPASEKEQAREERTDIVLLISEFEDLMIAELIDWIEISQRAKAELGP